VSYDPKDAPILAAAPDLLEALEKIEFWTRGDTRGTCEAVNAKALEAISKAKGR
jgi:hypothetical protein